MHNFPPFSVVFLSPSPNVFEAALLTSLPALEAQMVRDVSERASWKRFCLILVGCLRLWGGAADVGAAVTELSRDIVAKWIEYTASAQIGPGGGRKPNVSLSIFFFFFALKLPVFCR